MFFRRSFSKSPHFSRMKPRKRIGLCRGYSNLLNMWHSVQHIRHQQAGVVLHITVFGDQQVIAVLRNTVSDDQQASAVLHTTVWDYQQASIIIHTTFWTGNELQITCFSNAISFNPIVWSQLQAKIMGIRTLFLDRLFLNFILPEICMLQ